MTTIEQHAQWFKTHAKNKDDASLAMKFPSKYAVAEAEDECECEFPQQFKDYLMQLSPYDFGTYEPVRLVDPIYHNSIISVNEEARSGKLPLSHVPICQTNGCFYAVDVSSGKVQYWDHGSFTKESWPTVSDWVKDVWIASS